MRYLMLTGLMASLATTPLALPAQGGAGGGPRGGAPGRGRMMAPGDRAQLEQRFKERLAAVVQKRLGLNDDQTRRLSDVNQKYESKRMDIVSRERGTRIALRKELDDPSSANQDRVNQLLRDMARFQRDRLDLIDSEQADLSKFLTPVQRAQYLGLQEQVRRRVEEFRDHPAFMNDSTNADNRMGMRGRGRRPPTP